MRIRVNGEEREFDAGLTVEALLDRLGIARRGVAVERNGEVVPRRALDRTELADGDRLEIVRFVGGG